MVASSSAAVSSFRSYRISARPTCAGPRCGGVGCFARRVQRFPVGRQCRIQVALGALHVTQVVADADGQKASEELGAVFDSADDLRGLAAWTAAGFVGSAQFGEHLGQAALGWPEPSVQAGTAAWFQRTKERINRSFSARWARACWL